MISFKEYVEVCCEECDDSLYGIVEEEFASGGDEFVS